MIGTTMKRADSLTAASVTGRHSPIRPSLDATGSFAAADPPCLLHLLRPHGYQTLAWDPACHSDFLLA